MRKDTQIGIILGVVILVVIGVFLSTRPSVKEPKMTDLTLSEEDVSKVKIIDIEEMGVKEIDIRELAKASETEIMEMAETREETEEIVSEDDFVEERQIRREFGKRAPVEVPVKKDAAVIEGKWEGVEKEVGVIEEDISEISVPGKEIEELSKGATIPKKEQKVPATEIPPRKIIHKVVSSDSLVKLSKQYYGDETKWKIIYEANKDKIKSPDLLYTGLELMIPDITVSGKKEDVRPYESLSGKQPDKRLFTTTGRHTVRPGDTLYSLARKYYGVPAMWEKIYDANEDNIMDKRLLEVGQTLIIPE
jgi:phage tail protein X